MPPILGEIGIERFMNLGIRITTESATLLGDPSGCVCYFWESDVDICLRLSQSPDGEQRGNH